MGKATPFIFYGKDLAVPVSSANAATTRLPLTLLRRPDHEMPSFLVIRSSQSRVVDAPQVARALIPDNNWIFTAIRTYAGLKVESENPRC